MSASAGASRALSFLAVVLATLGCGTQSGGGLPGAAPDAAPPAAGAQAPPPPGPVPENGCRATATLLRLRPIANEDAIPPFLTGVARGRLRHATVRLDGVEPLRDGVENLCVPGVTVEIVAADLPAAGEATELRLTLELVGDTRARAWRLLSLEVVDKR